MKKKKLLKRIEELERLIKKQIYSKMEYSNVYCKECKLPMKQKAEMREDRSGIRVKYCFDVRNL